MDLRWYCNEDNFKIYCGRLYLSTLSLSYTHVFKVLCSSVNTVLVYAVN